nr:putative ribonuclease H-like domain-containing protein [Tanacetum cinerariifolium]
RKPALSSMRPFRYPVTILNTLDHLGNQTNGNAGPKSLKDEVADDVGKKSNEVPRKENEVQDPAKEGDKNDQEKDVRDQERALRKQFEQESKRLFGQRDVANTNITDRLNTISSSINADTADNEIFSGAYDDKVKDAMADFNNLKLTTIVSPIPTTMIHKDHPKEQIIGDPLLAPQTRRMIKTSQEHAMVSYIKRHRRTNHKDYQNCLFACFLSQIEPKKVNQALTYLRFQVTPKISRLHAMKSICRYLKGQPKLGLWYPRDLPFDLEAFLDGYYAGASLDKKSITGGCQFLGKKLISWQCKKKTVVANSTTEAKYILAANYCGQVSWIQN